MNCCDICFKNKNTYPVRINTDVMSVCGGCISIIRDLIADIRAGMVLS